MRSFSCSAVCSYALMLQAADSFRRETVAALEAEAAGAAEAQGLLDDLDTQVAPLMALKLSPCFD